MTMAKHKPRRRPKPEEVPQQPRNRLAEIRAEIRDVQQQIEARRRDAPVIRTPEDLTTWERTIAELTARLAALLLAEVMLVSPLTTLAMNSGRVWRTIVASSGSSRSIRWDGRS